MLIYSSSHAHTHTHITHAHPHTLTAPSQSPLLSGRDLGGTGASCHGDHSGQPVCLHEGPGVYRGQQPVCPQGDGEDRRVPGEMVWDGMYYFSDS